VATIVNQGGYEVAVLSGKTVVGEVEFQDIFLRWKLGPKTAELNSSQSQFLLGFLNETVFKENRWFQTDSSNVLDMEMVAVDRRNERIWQE